MAKFNCYVAVHKDPAESVHFKPGDTVPDWALPLVGDHVLEGNERDVEDVRLTDPQYEPDDPATKFSTTTTLPPEAGGTVEDVDEDDEDYSDLKKDELIALAEERGLETSGTKAEIIARLEADDEEDDEE